MIVDAGAGAVKGGKAYMVMRTAKLERQAMQVAIKVYKSNSTSRKDNL